MQSFQGRPSCHLTSFSTISTPWRTRRGGIEPRRDRAKAGWKGPRPLDIDILLYGDTVSDDPVLTLPHPGIKERGFVLIPLAELAPDLADPGTGEKYKYFIKNNMNFSVKYYKSSAIFDIIAPDGR